MDEFDHKLHKLVEHAFGQIYEKGSIQKVKNWFVKRFFRGPGKEISHDWHIVNSFLERTIVHIKRLPKTDIDYEKKILTLARIKAYLKMAKIETNFAEAWTYVNLADSFLPLVVNEDELGNCIMRLASRDRLITESILTTLPSEAQKILKDDNLMSVVIDGNLDRYKLYREQEMRALLWNSLNRKISFRISLWHSLEMYLLFALVLAVGVTEIISMLVPELMLVKDVNGKTMTSIPFPFIFVSILGFLGGGLSAYVKTRDKAVDITSYKTLKVYTILRMLLGAAGSFVVFIIIHFLGNDELNTLLNTNIYAFLGIGIVAGFSERLFIETMEKMADKLDIIGKTDQVKAEITC
jgi:hypothetical protein